MIVDSLLTPTQPKNQYINLSYRDLVSISTTNSVWFKVIASTNIPHYTFDVSYLCRKFSGCRVGIAGISYGYFCHTGYGFGKQEVYEQGSDLVLDVGFFAQDIAHLPNPLKVRIGLSDEYGMALSQYGFGEVDIPFDNKFSLVSPNGGQVLVAGATTTLTWNPGNTPDDGRMRILLEHEVGALETLVNKNGINKYTCTNSG